MIKGVEGNIRDTWSRHPELLERLHLQRERIDAALRESIPRSRGTVKQRCPLRSAMRYSLLSRGKRLRGVMCIESCMLTGGSAEAALPTACAIEMIHAMSLIHDDLPALDDAKLRRGQHANHVVFGDAQAILAGDALLAMAFGWISNQMHLPAETVVSVIRDLSRLTTLDGLAEGQSLELSLTETTGFDPDTYVHIARMKTGALFRASAVCGARLAGAPESHINHLGCFGEELGLAFQLMDDVVDSLASLDRCSDRSKPAVLEGLTREFGISGTKKRAIAHYKAALAALAEFGSPADPLRALAELAFGSQL